MQGLDWSDLIHVLAVSRLGNLAAASRRLGVNESTVSRRISRIEKQLNARLFERNNGVLTPTKAGESAIASAERIELETQTLEGSISDTDYKAAGSVRITSVPVIINHILIPLLPAFIAQHPQLEVELISEPKDLSLTRRETDIALRLARPTKELQVIAYRVGQLDYAVFGERGTKPELQSWINYEEGMSHLPQVKWISNASSTRGTLSSVKVSDAESMLASIKSGLGKSLLPICIANKETTLERHNDETAMSREIWLLVHPEIRKLTRIQITTNWLQQIFGKS